MPDVTYIVFFFSSFSVNERKLALKSIATRITRTRATTQTQTHAHNANSARMMAANTQAEQLVCVEQKSGE